MAIEIKIPSVGESIKEAVLAEWYKKDGEHVEKDEPLFVLETDKVTLEVVAETDGILKVMISEGETVTVGAKVGEIDPVITSPKKAATKKETAPKPPVETEQSQTKETPKSLSETPAPLPDKAEAIILPPSVRRLVSEKNIDPSKIKGTGPSGRITKSDVMFYLESAPAGVPENRDIPKVLGDKTLSETTPSEIRKAMTPIRKRIAQRLLSAKQNTAMLTTFNEIDMSTAMGVRSAYKDLFKEKHGVNLGFMSFFIMACVKALGELPEINAFIDGEEIVYHNYQHIGVAIGSGRGLVVPVIRHAERMGFSEIEKAIIGFVEKIKNNRLELADLEGGTFTVSNGGVYGSLLSTPILNSPQSGILGMHKIEKRPVVIDDEIVIRPMMYVALSYDHRIIDGREAVTFLKRIKEYVENPERMLLEV